ncbi:nitroreductase family protein [Mycolicibacterium rhodesiae]|uniref:Nitroreductase n=1 Tax=Mycolicibacterium rhodesiae TaxID=36814 RepID=A0A1X0IPU1_MYCRH|nr:nitroreductase [Mycolicibacterium rhodesiae]MCV7347767.1 nitroreductase [Mycolicibacterium rhodesiae]ORB50474.1 nitroreductase [Mycolicibacterium rhodesiae]
MSSLPDAATLETVLDLAARAPSLRNLQPWRWQVDDEAVHLYADWSRRAGDTPAHRRDVLLGCGAVLDHCVVAMAAAGWHPSVRRFPDRADNSHLAILEVVEQPPQGGWRELASAIPRRRADRRPYASRPIAPGTLELLYIRARKLDVDVQVVPTSRWTRLDDGAVELRYPTAAGEQSGETPDGPALLVVGTRRDDDTMRLRAGEALSHLTLTATAMGFASCPLTEPLNDTRSRLALACEAFDGAAYPQALIRIGHPLGDAEPPPPTERRAARDITVWTNR